MGEYGPRPSKLGSNTDLRPSAVGPYWTPISQDIGPYLPIRPRQSHRIIPLLLYELEAYSVSQDMNYRIHVCLEKLS